MATPVTPTATPTTGTRGPSTRRPPALWAYRLAGYVLLLGGWQLLATYVFASPLVPGPYKIALNIRDIAVSGDLAEHGSATLIRVAISMGFVFVIGGAIGILMGASRWWEAFFRDFVSLLISIPGLVFVLIFLIIFGFSPVGPIVAIVVTNFAFVTVQVWEGVRAIPTDVVDMSTSFRVPRARVVRSVYIPALAPFLFTALTYSFALTWKLTMLTELFGAQEGVGFMMRVEFSRFSVTGMLAWALTFFIFALLLERLVFQRLSRRFFRWRQGAFGGSL